MNGTSRTPEGDQLLGIIQALVHGRVPRNQELVVIEATAQALVTIMGDPQLYSHLRVVMDLQQENWNLRQQLLHAHRLLSAYNHPSQNGHTNGQMKLQVKKAPKKPAPRKAPAARKRVPPSNVRSFKRGATDR